MLIARKCVVNAVNDILESGNGNVKYETVKEILFQGPE